MQYILILSLVVFSFSGCSRSRDIVRPEPVVSKRKAVLETEQYSELAKLWQAYYDVFPSEDAYANWMYAARYAGDESYESLLMDGLDTFPANPTLLYLAGILHHGGINESEELGYLERAATLAPDYDDPWFALVTAYMQFDDEDKLNLALRRLLATSAVAEEVMDYNYNVLATLDSNAILFTNGDNDTYPCWILQKLLNYRSDVTVVNRSLLNTDWYPGYMIERGLPRFMTSSELADFRERRWDKLQKGGGVMPAGGPYADSLLCYITEFAEKIERPVYFALTLAKTDPLKTYFGRGNLQGLAMRVSPAKVTAEETADAMRRWMAEYRTAGLDSWSLRYARASAAGKTMIGNYGFAMVRSLDNLATAAPELRAELFEWYLRHLAFVLPVSHREIVEQEWCRQEGLPLVRAWCRSQGIAP